MKLKDCSSALKCFFGCSSVDDKSDRAKNGLITTVAIFAIGLAVVGALGLAGIIALSNPVSIGLVAFGGAIFWITILANAIRKINLPSVNNSNPNEQ